MSVAYRASTSSNTASGTSAVVNKPTGTVNNTDVLVLRVTIYDAAFVATTTGVTVTPPSGFTLRDRKEWAGVSDIANTSSQLIFTKLCGAAEGSTYTVNFSASCYTELDIVALSGADASTSSAHFDAISGNIGGINGTSIATAITVARNGSELLFYEAQSHGGTVTYPATFTQRELYDGNVYTGTRDFPTAGSSGTPSAAHGTNGSWVVHLLSIQPASGGTNTPMTISATQTQTAARTRALSKIALTKTQTQAVTLVRNVGRTRSATQAQTTSAGPSVVSGLGFTATQTQTTTRTRSLGTPKAVNETQTATRVRLVAPVKSAVNSQTPSLAKGQGYFKTLTATIVQTVALARALGLFRSALETQTLFRAVAIARALSALETQSKAIARAIATGRAVTGTQTAAFSRAVARLLSATETQTASGSRALSRALAATAAQTLSSVRALAKTLNVTNNLSPSVQVAPSGGGPVNYPKTLNATVSQTIAVARACARPLSGLQSQSITRARALTLLAKSATQTQSASVVKGQGYFKTLTATIAQASSVLKGQGYFKTLTATIAQTASRLRAVGSAQSTAQVQAATVRASYAVTRTAITNQTASRGRAVNVNKTANQAQTPAVQKGRGFFVTLAAVAIQAATFIKTVGLTRFAAQTHALDIQTEVSGGGFPVLLPAPPAYCAIGLDLRSGLYTTPGNDLRS